MLHCCWCQLLVLISNILCVRVGIIMYIFEKITLNILSKVFWNEKLKTTKVSTIAVVAVVVELDYRPVYVSLMDVVDEHD